MVKQKNYLIELCRFIGAIIILCHHSYIFNDRKYFIGGWMFVEFFYMLTGYFTASHFERDPQDKWTIQKVIMYVIDKVFKILPYAWAGILMGFVLYNCNSLSIDDRISGIVSLPSNLMFLKGLPISSHAVEFDPPLWFITNILVFLPIIIILMCFCKNIYLYLLSWFVPLVLYSVCMEQVGKIAIWEGGYLQNLRGIADIIIGTFLFYLVKYCRIKIKNLAFAPIIGSAIFVGYIWFTVKFRNGGVDLSAEMMILTFIVLGLLLLYVPTLNNQRAYSFFMHLGKLALPIYCIHFPIETIIQKKLLTYNYNIKLLLSIVLSILIAELIMFFLRLKLE